MKTDLNEIILYNTEDGKSEIKIILDSETQTIWLTQNQMAELFDIKPNTVTEHISHIYQEEELEQSSTTRSYRVVRQEASRKVERDITHYNLKLILAIGYRIRSDRGTQFRKWATEHLNEYLIKGFVLNSQRLKDPGGWDYFDELLEKIRDIRTSEKRFYQKVTDLFSQTSTDYSKTSPEARKFFSTIQNKLIFAETGMTAPELVINRIDSTKSNMGLTSWAGDKVRKKDIVVSKNYLNEKELKNLNRLVTMFLDFAEDRAEKHKKISMKDWVNQTEKFLKFNERENLSGAGSKSKIQMEKYTSEQYEKFQENRKQESLKISEKEHLAELENTIKEVERKNDK